MSLYCLAKNEWSWASLKVKYPILIGRLVDFGGIGLVMPWQPRWIYKFATQKYHQICHTCPFSVGRIGQPSPIFQNHPAFAYNALARPADILKTKIVIRMDQNGTLINQLNWSFFGSETNHFWWLIILTHVHCPSKLVRHSSVMEFHLTIWWFN